MNAYLTLCFCYCGALCAQPWSYPLLVLNARNEKGELPARLRQIEAWRLSGSGQYSEEGLKALLLTLKQPRVLLIDLREESHGFVNGEAVSWFVPQDTINRGKPCQQIVEDEQRRLSTLLQAGNATLYTVQEKDAFNGVSRATAQSIAVRAVCTESALHAEYARIPVPNHRKPSDEAVDAFIALVRRNSSQRWLHIHCKAGVGRTTTFMTLYAMMQTAKALSLEEIIEQQKAIGGKDLLALPPPSSWKYALLKERQEFITQYYLYCKANTDHFQTSWSAWKKIFLSN
jgi:protein tyrosine phosphatase (PTP) superfamily phosphohydrolase (DUF442 family)